MQFRSLNIIEPILKAVEEEGYTTPTPIHINFSQQRNAIPHDYKITGIEGTGKSEIGNGI